MEARGTAGPVGAVFLMSLTVVGIVIAATVSVRLEAAVGSRARR